MPRKSSISSLPDKLLAGLDERIKAGSSTLDGLERWLHDVGHPRSRSALARYVREVNKRFEQIRQQREITRMLVNRLGEAEVEGQSGRLIAEIIGNIVHVAAAQRADKRGEIDVAEIEKLARTLLHLQKSTVLAARHEKEAARANANNAEKLQAAVDAGEIKAEAAADALRVLGLEL